MIVCFSRGLSNLRSTRRRLTVVGVVLALLFCLSNSFGIPIARAGWISPADLINLDGSLNLNGNTGMIDVHGWNVQLDPQRGPVFAPNAPNANAWSPLGFGVDNYVTVIAVSGSDVYLGGRFEDVCGNDTCNSGTITVNNIAKWSAATGTWSALGNGVNAHVYALALSGSDVYVGGYFEYVCGNAACTGGNTTVNHIAKWSSATNTWSALKSGVSDTVFALASTGSDVYVGGHFFYVCGNDACNSGNTTVNHIAKWSSATNTWSTLKSGVSDSVFALVSSGSDVYVGGWFLAFCGYMCQIGNTTVNHIAKWSSATGGWYPVGKGVNDSVYALAISGSNVYVGGDMTEVCSTFECDTSGVTVNYVARWNGSSWSALRKGVDNTVRTLAVRGDEVFAGGFFTKECDNEVCDGGYQVNYLLDWNGSNWYSVNYGMNDRVYALAVSGSDIYVGGNFTEVCGSYQCNSNNSKANHVAKYGPAPPTPTPTIPPTSTSTPTATPTSTPTATPTSTPTATPTSTPTATPTSTPTATPTSTPINSCIAKPAKPKLTVPVNGAVITKSKVSLQWSNVLCETKYQVRVKSGATNKIVFKANPGADVSKIKTNVLAKGTTYKWYVKACNGLGCAKSAARTFHVP